jgi:hypothetical protein
LLLRLHDKHHGCHMKTACLIRSPHRPLLWSVLAFLGVTSAPLFSQPAQPVITSIRPEGTNVVVCVSAPAGFQRITLESRACFGVGAWVPVAVAQPDSAGGTLTFRLPCARQFEMLRVRADTVQSLPAAFYIGTNSFWGPPTNSVVVSAIGGPGDGLTPTQTPTGGSARAVVESDIWELSGDTLYFFNQYRGLQVVDISNPDVATVRGTLDLPAAGEQMYLLDSNHVVLLASSGCSYSSGDSQVLVVAVSNGLPRLVASLPVQGSIQESRMVGTALYVASQMYRPVPGSTNTTWEWGTLVSSFDLAQPGNPVSRDTLWYAGYGNVVSATDIYLFVVTQDPANWWQSVVQLIDITAPDGTMNPYGSLRTEGRLQDKFKLNYADEVFTAISEDWHWDNGTLLVTDLETFHLPDPRSTGPAGIFKLGDLELGNHQQLHATRFDGNLVYVVTFFQIDPLWVVDLSDPAQPHIAGSLEVSGWSSYLQPLGNRLVSLGVVSNRVAVSLFDVHDPAHPALLSRLLLGQNYSWSDANYDEKAFAVLPDNGLILVPYNGDTTNGWTSQLQLLDLTSSNLVARGIIQHQVQPRRAAFSHNRILSLSGWELLSVDAADRDHPVVRGDTELAWSVDRVFLHGNYLLELDASTGWWGHQNRPAVRVASAAAPSLVLNELFLDGQPIVGATVRDDRLYIAQSQTYFYPLPLAGGAGGPTYPCTNGPNFTVSVLDLSALPSVSISGQVSVAVDVPPWGGSWEAVWPKSDVLVWAGGGLNFWWLPPIFPAAGGVGVVGGAPAIAWPIWGFGGGGQLLAFDVSHPAAPKFDSEVNLATNAWWSFSKPFSSGSLVYLSHSASEFLPAVQSPGTSPTGGPLPPGGTGGNPSNTVPGCWVQRFYLDVIDYIDPLTPTVRKPVNIPGTLSGLSGAGELLYTTGVHATNAITDWRQWLDASAYDGVAAHLVASLALPDAWPHPLLVADTNVFLGRPGYNYSNTNLVAHQLEAWTLQASGSFGLLGKVTLPLPASTLITRGSLLAAQETDNSVALFDDSNPAALLPVGRGTPSGCLWFDLNQADGTVARGLWIPLGVYGVEQVHPGP